MPAHFSGICGLKPTPGRIPSTGHFPASGGPFALLGVVGPMARTVADLKTFVRGDARSGRWRYLCGARPASVAERDEVRQLRVGYFEDDGRTPVTQEIRDAVRRSRRRFGARRISRSSLFRPEGLEEARVLWRKFFVKAGGMSDRPDV